MDIVNNDLEVTCGVCLEKLVIKFIKDQPCFTAVDGMQAVMFHEARKSVYPASGDGKSVLIMDSQTNSPLTVMWNELLTILNNTNQIVSRSNDDNNNNQQQQQQQQQSQASDFDGISSKKKTQQQQQQKKKSNLSVLLEDDDSNEDNNILEIDSNEKNSTHPTDTFDVNEILIMSVEARPPLWDHRLEPAERSVAAKNKLWEEIVDAPGIKGILNVKTAKAKWKNLFDNYRKIIQQEQYETKKSGSAATPKRAKWDYYDIMSFVQDRCLITQTISNRKNDTSNYGSDEENEETVRSNRNKRRRSKTQGDGDSSTSALMLIAEKLSAPELPLPPMPVQDDVDLSLAVVGNNCRQLPQRERTNFLRKLVLLSFDALIDQNE